MKNVPQIVKTNRFTCILPSQFLSLESLLSLTVTTWTMIWSLTACRLSGMWPEKTLPLILTISWRLGEFLSFGMLSNDNGFLNLHHYVIRIQTWDSTLVHNNAHINLDIDTSINIVILASIDVRVLCREHCCVTSNSTKRVKRIINDCCWWWCVWSLPKFIQILIIVPYYLINMQIK